MVDLRSGCARVLVTDRCDKSCPYCVNKNADVMAKAQRVGYHDLMERLQWFKELAVTGGEPMLDPLATEIFIQDARQVNPGIKVWLYTSWFRQEDIFNVLPLIDGLTFTLHTPVGPEALGQMFLLQVLSRKWDKPFRLCIGPGIDREIHFIPSRWSRVKSFDLSPEACRLPANEVLYILDEGGDGAQDKV